MAYDIGPKIGIDGEAEFRSAINGINDNLKTLGTEMKSVVSQFDKGDNSMEALTAQNEVLNKQIDTQTDKLGELKKGLEAAAEKYGENDKVTQGWQRSVNQATADLNNMERELKNNKEAMEKAKDPTDDLAKEIEDVGKEAKGAEKHIFSMGDMIKANLISEAIIGGVKALGTAMLSVASGVKDAVMNTVDYASDIKDMSDKTGVGAEELQKYAYAAKMSGMETETLEKAMVKSQKSFADAKEGSKSLNEAYSRLGIDINKISNSEEAFDATLKALAGMEDETTRNALANDLFGKSYAELAPLLNEGADGIDALKQKAADLGIVMSEDAVNSGEALGDTLDTIKQQASGVANTFVSMLLPGLSELATGASEYMQGFSKDIQAANGDMGQIGEVIGNALSDVVNKIVEKLPEFIEGAKSIVTSLAGGIKDNLPTIIETGMEIIMDLAKSLIESLPEIIATGLEIIVSLAQGIADSLPELIPVVVDTILTIVENLIDNVDNLIDAALAIIMALADGLIEALPKLIEKAPTIIIKLVEAIVKNGPKILESGITLILKLGEGIINAVPQLIKNIPQIITALVKGLKEGIGEMASVGLNLVQGLWNGISNATDWIISKLKGFGSSVLNGIKDFFGIHSPSTVFEDEVGKNLALGLGKGFTDEMSDITNDINASIPTDFEVNGSYNLSGSSGGVNADIFNAFAAVATDIIVPAFRAIGVNIEIGANSDGLFKLIQVKSAEYAKRTGLDPFPAKG
jgi:phage-related protein